jgi:hypothetical protein
MGYDMTLHGGAPAEIEEEARRVKHELDVARERFRELGPDAGPQDIDREKMFELLTAGMPMREAEAAAARTPPSEEWLIRGKEFDAAIDALNQDLTYFRANIAGMSLLRGVMENFGMVADSGPLTTWPVPTDYGTDWDEAHEQRETGKCDENVRAFLDQHDAHLRDPGNDEGLMGVHKFCSNDGWVVTPAEIHESLERYDRVKAENPAGFEKAMALLDEQGNGLRSFWERWIAYLRVAEISDGFEVW